MADLAADLHRDWDGASVKYANIAVTTTSPPEEETFLAAVTGKKLRIYAIVVDGVSSDLFQLLSGSGGSVILRGLTNATTHRGYSLPFCPVGWCETDAGDALIFNQPGSVAATFTANIVYAEVD